MSLPLSSSRVATQGLTVGPSQRSLRSDSHAQSVKTRFCYSSRVGSNPNNFWTRHFGNPNRSSHSVTFLGRQCIVTCAKGDEKSKVNSPESKGKPPHSMGKLPDKAYQYFSKPESIDELLNESDADREWWESDSTLNDLSAPARNVADWINIPTPDVKKPRPKWAWWPESENVTNDVSLNMGLISPSGMSVSRLMTQEEWTRHRNPWRYYRHLLSMLRDRSTILWRTRVNILIVTAWTTLICSFNTKFPQHALQCNPVPFTIIGAFVSLLLVFRTNSCYGRFLEARGLLGQLVLHTREFARLAVVHFPTYALRKRSMAYVSAFAWLLKARVRSHDNPQGPVTELLGPHETKQLLRKSKPAFFALQELTNMVASCEREIPDYVARGLNDQLMEMDRVLGGCERLLTTPIPVSYTRHTTRSLILFLIGLPFGLWSVLGWNTVLVTMLIAFITLGIDETGFGIEEPFAIMPIQQLCQVVTATCRESLEYYG